MICQDPLRLGQLPPPPWFWARHPSILMNGFQWRQQRPKKRYRVLSWPPPTLYKQTFDLKKQSVWLGPLPGPLHCNTYRTHCNTEIDKTKCVTSRGSTHVDLRPPGALAVPSASSLAPPPPPPAPAPPPHLPPEKGSGCCSHFSCFVLFKGKGTV